MKGMRNFLWVVLGFGLFIGFFPATWTLSRVSAAPLVVAPPGIEWCRQFGTWGNDEAFDVATDSSGNIYVAETYRLRKFSPQGVQLWEKRTCYACGSGITSFGGTHGVAVDYSISPPDIYVTGLRQVPYPPDPKGAYFVAFIEKYRSTDGLLIWCKEFGDTTTYANTEGEKIAVDSFGDIYVVGLTEGSLGGESCKGLHDFFISKRSGTNGDEIWTREFGTPDVEFAPDIAIDSSGKIFFGGGTTGHFDTPAPPPHNSDWDFVVRKYDSDGNLVWGKQSGTFPASEYFGGIAVDAFGSIYACGTFHINALIRKFDQDGNEVLATQLLTATGSCVARDIAADHCGHVFLSGFTDGAFPGQTSAGGDDVFISELNNNLQELWTKQFGTPGYEHGWGITVHDSEVYVCGSTDGVFDGQTSEGLMDAFLLKLVSSNMPATADAGQDLTVLDSDNDGLATVTFNGSGSTDPEGDIQTYTWTWDGEIATGINPTVSLSIGTHTITLTVAECEGRSSTDEVIVTVKPLSTPVAKAGGPYLGTEGTPVYLNGAASTDPENDIVSYEWDLDGDAVYDDASGATPMVSWPDNVTLTVGLKVTDISGLTSTDTATVTIGNSPPAITGITTPIDPVPVNTPINVSGTFTDPGLLDTHTAVWNWGDGTTSAGVVTETGGSGSVAGSHSYTVPGIYTVILTVTDKDGASAQASSTLLVVYDPTGGFVTGAGWFESPPGAYSPDPTLMGKAHFGFVSKYQKGATVPTGQTKFHFQVANLNFHSDIYEWMVVAGARVQYKGVGTINNQSAYGFMIVAIDGEIPGGGGLDKFRIKIWETATGIIVYDNEMGTSETGNPFTVIEGGSIVIHKQ